MTRVLIAVSLAVAILWWTPGCTENLAPREPYPEPFSVYGVLTPDRDTQFVWVSAIEEFPSFGTADALSDVTVTSTDLETGEVRVWQDTVVVRENGQHEYLYRSRFRAAYDRSYRLDLHRQGDEESTWAEVRIPPPVEVRIVGASGNTVTVEVIGEQVRALNTEVEYRVRFSRCGGFPRPDTSYRRTYPGKEEQIDSGWRMDIRLNVDRYWVEAWYVFDMNTPYPASPFLALGEAKLHALIGDVAWDPPGGIFDPRVLSHPRTMENVENGTGFIGGGYRIEKVLDIPREAVEAARFFYCSRPWECNFDFWPACQ